MVGNDKDHYRVKYGDILTKMAPNSNDLAQEKAYHMDFWLDFRGITYSVNNC